MNNGLYTDNSRSYKPPRHLYTMTFIIEAIGFMAGFFSKFQELHKTGSDDTPLDIILTYSFGLHDEVLRLML